MSNAASATATEPRQRASPYAWYVLALLMVIYAFNFIDRQIITILAPYIKEDLGITDAQIGLLYGTAFAVFYSVFGIPLAKLADGWSRVQTLSLGLVFWSSMTTLSGYASNFAQLGLARLGVGVGEASGSPAAVSLLSDYFPKHIRASIFALYTTGMFIGVGASLMIGGIVVGALDGFAGMSGWQLAFIAVGAPGIVLGLLVITTVREPVRGALDGQPQVGASKPFQAVLAELATMTPPFALISLSKNGASARTIGLNVLLFALIAVAAAGLIAVSEAWLSPARRAVVFVLFDFPFTTSFIQWLAVGLGIYAALSWVQAIRLRDPVAYALTVGAPAYRLMAMSGALLGVYTYAIGAFVFLYGARYLALRPEDGLTLGAITVLAGASGAAVGGFLGDMLRRWTKAGRLYLIMVWLLGFTAATVLQFTTTSAQLFFAAHGAALFALTAWAPLLLATAQDLVIPRLRGAAFAIQTLCTSLIGLGVGPYVVGFVSDVTGDLRFAILSTLAIMPALLWVLWRCARRLPEGEASVLERAKAAGEAL